MCVHVDDDCDIERVTMHPYYNTFTPQWVNLRTMILWKFDHFPLYPSPHQFPGPGRRKSCLLPTLGNDRSP